jgi:divalent metal cation (Fe/Co/Zn/Cd) transporter
MVADVGIIPGSKLWIRLARIAKILAALTLVWLGIEGTIGVVAGVLAGSIALVAFGLDSAIEGLASVIVLWRFTGSRTISPVAERQAQKCVAVSFYLLAPYVAVEAIETLIEGAAAETSWLGIALTTGTLVLCPWLGIAKQRVGAKLESRATYGEGTQNVLCAILAGAVLVGLAANSLRFFAD